jgi:gamma-glutamyl-gamma-aminobutyrate hydrolase PuuD
MSHETNDLAKDPYSAMHDIVFTPAFTTVRNFTDQLLIPVNSRHHQSVDEITLPDVLKVLAVHKSFSRQNRPGVSDGTIELMAHEALPIVSFQMHPEDMYEPATVSFVHRIIRFLTLNKRSILR